VFSAVPDGVVVVVVVVVVVEVVGLGAGVALGIFGLGVMSSVTVESVVSVQ